jgi:hypothetical protein
MFAHNLEAQIEAGVNGVIIGGSLGEASTLTLEEKETLIKYSIEKSAGRAAVLLNIAEGSTHEAVNQARQAEEWGADGLMLLPPMRYKSDHRETVAFFKTVANATSLPVMIYNNPVDYKIEVTMEMFEELVELPNIEAVKESTRDVSNVTRMINRFGNRIKILCGVDTIALEELLMGAPDGRLRLGRRPGGCFPGRDGSHLPVGKGRPDRRRTGDPPLVPAVARARSPSQAGAVYQAGGSGSRPRHRICAGTAFAADR